jgi:acyl carrier protein
MSSGEADEIRLFLMAQAARQGRDKITIDDRTHLFRENILDSFGVLELFAFLEEAFHVRLEKDEIKPENVETIQAILVFLRSRKEHRGTEWRVSE